MNDFPMEWSENFLLLSGLKLTLLLGCLWGVYFGMPRVSPLWKARFWRIGAVMLLVVAVLSLMPPQLTVELSRPKTDAISKFVESQSSEIQATEALLVLQNVERRFDAAPIVVDRDRVGSSSKLDSQKPFSLSTVLFGVWLMGLFLAAFRWSAITMKVRQVCKRSSPVTAASKNVVSELSTKLGVRHVPSLFHAEVASPCLAYCPRPAIMLPIDFDVSAESSQAVFAHELAHLKRRDWQWNLVLAIVQAILWFHPFVWRIRSTHMNECESACDDLAAELIGGRSVYQQALAQVALSHASQSPVVGLSMVRKPEIIHRLKRLGLPVVEFSLNKLFTAISATAIATSLIATLGVAYIDSKFDEDDAKINSNEYSFQIAVNDSELKGTSVEFQWYVKGSKEAQSRKSTPDKDGWVRGQLGSEPLSNVTIVCRTPGYVPFAFTRHARNRSIVLPKNQTVYLEESRTLSGLVRDSGGIPIKNAMISVDMASQDSWDQSRHFDLANAKTDRNGKWTIKNAPWNLKASKVNIRISHPEYLQAWGSVPEYPGREPGSKATMFRGVQLAGAVVDEQGQPIDGVRVTLGHQSVVLPRPPEDVTDKKGRFKLLNCRPGSRFIVASKDGYAPELVDLVIDEKRNLEADEMKLVLKPGKTIKARLRDQNGDPVVNAIVAIQQWRKDHSLGFHTKTDAEGRFEWHDAPDDDVWFTFSGKKHRLIVFHKLNHSENEHEVLIYTRQNVRLKLVDADTNAVIQDASAMRGLKFSNESSDVSWDGSWIPFVGGEIEYTFRRSVPETWLKINARGYRPRIEKFMLGEEDKELTVKLQPLSLNKNAAHNLSVSQEASIRQLKKLGAEIEQTKNDVSRIKLVGPWEIPSALHGVPDINVNPKRAVWTGGLQDLKLLNGLRQVELTLDGVHMDDEFLASLSKVDSIVSLDLDGCPWELSIAGCEMLGEMKSVHSLKLDGRWQKFPSEAFEAMAKMPKLETLIFDGCGAYHMDERTLRGRLSKLTTLKQLVLNSDTGFGNGAGGEISQLQHLESLGIRGRTLGDKFINEISGLQLRKLDLSMTGITDIGLKTIADSFPQLEELNVERTGITADGIRNVMGQFPALRKLTVEMLDEGKTLLEFKRRHLDCAIHPITYGRGSVMSHGTIELPDSDQN